MPKVLLPFDGSDSAMRAARYAAALAKENPAIQLELLYVLDPMTLRAHAGLSQQDIERLHADETARVVAPAKQALADAGIACEVHSRAGSPANRIAEYVHDTGCDAIIMGTRGLGPVASMMIGSVAIKVIHLVDVPVTLVK